MQDSVDAHDDARIARTILRPTQEQNTTSHVMYSTSPIVTELSKSSDHFRFRNPFTHDVIARHNQLLLLPFIPNHELPLANMFPLLAFSRLPHLVIKRPPPLPLLVLVDTARIQAGVKPAFCLDMSEFATLPRAVGSIATHRHRRVAEGAGGISTVREELAVLIGLVGSFLSGRRVSGDTFPVFAGGAKGAMVVDVDGGSGRRGGRLVCEYAIGLTAFEIEFADSVWGHFR